METKDFISLIPRESRKRIDSLFKNARDHKQIFYSAASELFLPDQIPLFEAFALSPDCVSFIKSRLKISLGRFEKTLHLLLRRVAVGIAPETIAHIAERMSAEDYRRVERSFFMVPVDRETYELYEKGFVQIGEQNQALLHEYLTFCSSASFVELRQYYLFDRDLFGDVFQRLIGWLLSRRSAEAPEKAVHFLCRREVLRFVHLSYELKKWRDFILNLFELFYQHPDPEYFADLLKILSLRYPPPKRSSGGRESNAFLFGRLQGLWPFFHALPRENTGDFREFLRLYGHPRDELETFVWDVVFSLEPARCVKGIIIFNSGAFTSIRGFYGQDVTTLKFLTKNIVAVLMEIEIKDLQSSLYRIVLKLLLGLKVERNFLRRRADFFKWMKNRSSSLRLELEVIRYLFFEYIYIALRLVQNSYGMKMTRFCDPNHKYFCEMIDDVYGNKFRMRGRDVKEVFDPLLDALRRTVWKPLRDKFADREPLFVQVMSVAESLDREDVLFLSLEQVEPEHLEFYHDSLITVFRGDPERVDLALLPDYWYRVSLALAMPHALSAVLPLAGNVPVLESPEGGAHTDGRAIYLPPYINYFRDPLDPLIENRNLTVFVGLAMHEAGHILAGSFRFNLNYYMSKLERPDLFKFLFNLFEDFRIERFLVLIRVHHQLEDILCTLNEYYALSTFPLQIGYAARFVFHIVNEAGGYNSLLKEGPEYGEALEALQRAELNTGRFRSLGEMMEYGVERLRHLETGNPLAAYPLAREFYEIMKHWPEAELEGLLDDSYMPKGWDDYVSGEGAGRGAPLTQEDLEGLYREYDEDPRAFLRRHELPAYAELLGGEGDEGDTREAGRGMSVAALEGYIGVLLDEAIHPDYSEAGVIDFSHRTKADDEAARLQTEGDAGKSKGPGKEKGTPGKKKSKGKKPKGGKKKSPGKKYVYTIDPRTKSRTRISEVREFVVRNVDPVFFHRFRKWEYLAQRVYQQLAVLLPAVEEKYETSAFEGEISVDLLIEVLAGRPLQETPEYMDIYTETRRSLHVVIGLDASYSTSLWVQPYTGVLTGEVKNVDGISLVEVPLSKEEFYNYDEILDIEKAFAVIFGTALSYLTDRLEVFAFNSVTSTNVYRADTLKAVSSFKADAANRDGDFIRYVRQILEQSDADVKYFILLSDGRPEADNYSGKEALDDTLIAMRETVNAGIKLIYFNVDMHRGDYFDLFKREATYAEYFTNPEQLLPVIPELVRKVVESVK